MQVPEACQLESQLTLQLLMDRTLKNKLENKAKAHEHPIGSGAGEPLTMRERNAIRYMAGYVAVKLLKRYKALKAEAILYC